MGLKERNKAIKKTNQTNGLKERNQRIRQKSQYESTIGFDTFEADLKSLGTSVKSVYDGWQTAETMNNTKSSIEAMQQRIGAYQEYRKMFGEDKLSDLTDISTSYSQSEYRNFHTLYFCQLVRTGCDGRTSCSDVINK